MKNLKVPVYFHLRADLAEAMEKFLKAKNISKTEYLTALIKSDLSTKTKNNEKL
jgi:hypothetical protein